MDVRPATAADLPAITNLQRRWDAAHFGSPEHDEREVAESFERVASPAEHSRLVFAGDRLVGAAYWAGSETTLLVDPDDAAVRAELVAWWAAQPVGSIEVLERDEGLRRAVTDRGWTQTRSSFELIRDAARWELAAPTWPEDVQIRNLRPDDAAGLYRLIYVDAAWAEVPGHEDRAFEQWNELFMTGADAAQQVLAWRGDSLIGAVIGKTFSDGTGWVSQLAVSRRERGAGLGRALLLEAFARRLAGGATSLGLAVQAENRGALSLYLGIGLHIDREWITYLRP